MTNLLSAEEAHALTLASTKMLKEDIFKRIRSAAAAGQDIVCWDATNIQKDVGDAILSTLLDNSFKVETVSDKNGPSNIWFIKW